MSIGDLTLVDGLRIIVAGRALFGNDVTMDDLKKLVKATDADPPAFSNPPPVFSEAYKLALRLRTALVKAHGEAYVADLQERIRKPKS